MENYFFIVLRIMHKKSDQIKNKSFSSKGVGVEDC